MNFQGDDVSLDLGGAAKKNRRSAMKTLGLYSSTLAVGVYLFIGHTFGANITINTGQPVQFGQGLLQTTACSGGNSITLKPTATFSNGSGSSGSFYFNGVTLTGVPTSCYGAKFTLRAFDSGTATALNIFGNNQSEVNFVDDSGTFTPLTGGNGLTITTNSSTSLTITFDQPISVAGNVIKLLLESFPYSAVTSSTCSSYLATTSNTTISVSGGTCIVSFTASTNTFTAPTGVKSIAVLVVAGGGGGSKCIR